VENLNCVLIYICLAIHPVSKVLDGLFYSQVLKMISDCYLHHCLGYFPVIDICDDSGSVHVPS
jgi:hypothetical protein